MLTSTLLFLSTVLQAACSMQYNVKGSDTLYVSRTGVDSPACGSKSLPCRTIAMAMEQSRSLSSAVFIDGTGTTQDPYTCVTSHHPGPFANKSLALIGYHAPVFIACRRGLGFYFESGGDFHMETVIKMSNIHFLNSSLTFIDCSVVIDNCSFVGGSRPISITQNIRMVTLSVKNSNCTSTTVCFGVEINAQNQSTNVINIRLSNCTITGTQGVYTPVSRTAGTCLSVTSKSAHAPGLIKLDVRLEHVAFTVCRFSGPHGLLYFNISTGFGNFTLDHVTVIGGYAQGFKNSEHNSAVRITGFDELNIQVNDSYFLQNSNSRFLSIESPGIIRVSLKNCTFSDNRSPGQGSVVFLSTESNATLDIIGTMFTNNSASGDGGCFSASARSLIVNVLDSAFLASVSVHGDSGAMSLNASETSHITLVNSQFSETSGNGKGGGVIACRIFTDLILKVQNCQFFASSSTGYGGVFDCRGEKLMISILDSFFNDSISQLQGGVLYANGPDGKTAITLDISLQRVRVDYSIAAQGGVIAFAALQKGTVLINDSVISNTNSSSAGGVISSRISGDTASSLGLTIDITNTTFKNSYAREAGGILYAEGVANFSCSNVHVDSAVTDTASGGAFFLVCYPNLISLKVSINNASFTNCTSGGPGGAIYVRNNYDKSFSELTLSNSVFQSCTTRSSGGAILMEFGNSDVHIENTTFASCQGYNGGALEVATTGDSNIITLTSCMFRDNSSPLAPGGAIAIFASKDNLSDSGCTTKHRRQWKYATRTTITDSTFEENAAQTGGALYLAQGQTIIRGCYFKDNFAARLAGHLTTIGESTSVEIWNTTFLQTKYSKKVNGLLYTFYSLYFILLESAGPFVLNSTVLELSILGGIRPLLWIAKGGQVQIKGTPLLCPLGSSLEVFDFSNQITIQNGSKPCTLDITVIDMMCKSCLPGYYSLQRGHSSNGSPNGIEIKQIFCLPCPDGAECLENIRAMDNFWGYKTQENPPTLKFAVCPGNYCKQPTYYGTVYNACQGNRVGTLCGRCRAGYTETLISPVCRLSKDCHDRWFWGVAALFYLSLALYLITKPPLFALLGRQILWIKRLRDEHRVTSTRLRDELGVTPARLRDQTVETRGDSGYLKIIFYFYQVANLLMVSTTTGALAKRLILQPVLGLFNFQLRLSSNGMLCPFPGLNPVTKELFLALQVFAVLFSVILWYALSWALRFITKRPRPNLGPYLAAVMETLLLGYAASAKASLQLLKCVPMNTESRLFIWADVTCYQWWQYVLMGFLCVNLVPFILVLALGSLWLDKETISAKKLLIGCFFPLPFLVYRLTGYLWGSKFDSQDPPEWKSSIQSVLQGPFRPRVSSQLGAFYWESVLIGRRLVLIILYVAIEEPFTRQISLALVCVIILLHHSLMRPFQDFRANATETVSLLFLVVIATLNILRAGHLALGQSPKGTFKDILEVYDWLELSLLAILPVCFIICVLVFLSSQVIRLIYMAASIRCHGKTHDIQKLLQNVIEGSQESSTNQDNRERK